MTMRRRGRRVVREQPYPKASVELTPELREAVWAETARTGQSLAELVRDGLEVQLTLAPIGRLLQDEAEQLGEAPAAFVRRAVEMRLRYLKRKREGELIGGIKSAKDDLVVG